MFILGILLWLVLVVAIIIAYWRIFERAWQPWWYALVWPIGWFILGLIWWKSNSILYYILSFAVMSFNLFVFAKIADKVKNFWYYVWWLMLWMILLYLNKLIILQVVFDIFAFVQIIIISYWLAQSFWRRKSASVLFALTPWLNYFVLGFSNDEYIWNKGTANISNNWINSNLSSDINIIMQDESESIIEPVDPRMNSMNWTGVNLNNISWDNIDSNSVEDWNVDLENININELTPIWAMERPSHNNDSNNL